VLAFTSVYFFESGLFNGLRPFGIKFRPSRARPSNHQIGLILPSSIGNAAGGPTHTVRRMEMCNTDSVFLQQKCREASRNEVSVGSGSSWESSEPSGAYLGRAAGRLHGHKRAFHVHGGYAERKIAGFAGEAPIADPARAMPALHRGVRALEPQRVLDDQAFRSFFGLRGETAAAAKPRRRSGRIFEAPESD
jgi:hypothetical protein